MNLEQLYTKITGEQFPTNLVIPSRPNVIIDKKNDMHATDAPFVRADKTNKKMVSETILNEYSQMPNGTYIIDLGNGQKIYITNNSNSNIETIIDQLKKQGIIKSGGGNIVTQPDNSKNTQQNQPSDTTFNLVQFSPSASVAAKQKFVSDLNYTKGVLDKHGIGKLVMTVPIKFHTISYAAPRSVAGCYWLEEDRMEVDMDHGYRYGSYFYVTAHELGHRFEFITNERVPSGETHNLEYHTYALYKHAIRTGSFIPSDYSRKDHFEYWAECFSFYFMNQISDEYLAEWVVTCIQKFKSVLSY